MKASTVSDPELLDALFRTLRSVQMHGQHHPQGIGAVADFVAVITPRLPVVVTFAAGGAFVDGTIVPINLEGWQRVKAVMEPLKTMVANELHFRVGLTAEEMMAVGVAWAEGARGNRFAIDELGALAGVGFRGLGSVSRGKNVEVVDRDVAVVAEAALAVRDAEGLQLETEAWTQQALIVRRLERRVFEHPHPAMVAFEQSTPTVPRRAISATVIAGALLRHLGASAAATRAGAHAALVMGLGGLQHRGGYGLVEARRRGLQWVLADPWGRSGVEPHRLRVASLLLTTADSTTDAGGHPILDVTTLAYEVERRRCPEHLPFDLSNADLWAAVATRAGIDFKLRSLRALISCFGAVPAGAWVRLEDGRTALVLGPDANGAPLLLLEGTPTPWTGVLTLLSAAEVR